MEMYVTKAQDGSFLEDEEIDIVSNLVEQYYFTESLFNDKNLLSIYLLKPDTDYEPAKILSAYGDKCNRRYSASFEQVCWTQVAKILEYMAATTDDDSDRYTVFRFDIKANFEEPMKATMLVQKNANFYTIVFVNTKTSEPDDLQVAVEGICGLFYTIFILLECGKDYDPPLLEVEDLIDTITSTNIKKKVVNWFKDGSKRLIKDWHALIKRMEEQQQNEQ